MSEEPCTHQADNTSRPIKCCITITITIIYTLMLIRLCIYVIIVINYFYHFPLHKWAVNEVFPN